MTAFLIPFHSPYITHYSLPSKNQIIGLTTAMINQSFGYSVLAVSLPMQLGVAKLIINFPRSLAKSYLRMFKDSEKLLLVSGFC